MRRFDIFDCCKSVMETTVIDGAASLAPVSALSFVEARDGGAIVVFKWNKGDYLVPVDVEVRIDGKKYKRRIDCWVTNGGDYMFNVGLKLPDCFKAKRHNVSLLSASIEAQADILTAMGVPLGI